MRAFVDGVSKQLSSHQSSWLPRWPWPPVLLDPTPIFRRLRPNRNRQQPRARRTRSLPTSTASTQQKVLTAWLAAEEQIYTYADEPPAPLRADLVAGQTTTDLFPKLGDYYVNPALQSEGIFLLKLKMQLLNGPTSLQPRESHRHCSHVQPPPPSHSAPPIPAQRQPRVNPARSRSTVAPGRWRRGTSTLELVSGSWKIASGQSTGVTKC